MAAFSTIFAGLGAAASAGSAMSGLFGGGGGGGGGGMYNMLLAMNAMQQNQLRQQQMNLDATRRRREVIRSAQVATANAEAVAFANGGGNSSSLEGARGAIAGQQGVNIQGIEQNREIGNDMFALDNQRGQYLWNRSEAQAQYQGQQAFKNTLFKEAGAIGKLADFGWGKLTNFASSAGAGAPMQLGAYSSTGNNWNNSWDVYQVGSNA